MPGKHSTTNQMTSWSLGPRLFSKHSCLHVKPMNHADPTSTPSSDTVVVISLWPTCVRGHCPNIPGSFKDSIIPVSAVSCVVFRTQALRQGAAQPRSARLAQVLNCREQTNEGVLQADIFSFESKQLQQGGRHSRPGRGPPLLLCDFQLSCWAPCPSRKEKIRHECNRSVHLPSQRSLEPWTGKGKPPQFCILSNFLSVSSGVFSCSV